MLVAGVGEAFLGGFFFSGLGELAPLSLLLFKLVAVSISLFSTFISLVLFGFSF